MPVPTTNVGLSDIAAEFGGTVPHALSEYYGDGNAPASGAIRFSDLAGTSAGLTLKSYGKIIETNSNTTSYSGTLAASVAVGDTIIISKVTGFGDYDYGIDTVQSQTPSYLFSSRAWSNPYYGHHRILRYVATSSASSISLSCSEGTASRQGMFCYAWLIGGTADYKDSDTTIGSCTVDTGEVGATVVISAYTDDSFSMPTISGADYTITTDMDMHVNRGHKVQTDTSATASFTTGSATSSIVMSFVKAP